MPTELRQQYNSQTWKLTVVRDEYMAGEIEKLCAEYGVVFVALLGAAHLGIATLLREKEKNITVWEILSSTPDYETMLHVDKLINHYPEFLADFFIHHKPAQNGYSVEHMAVILIVACMFIANEKRKIPVCGDYKFDGLKLNYDDPDANYNKQLEDFLCLKFSHLLTADSVSDVIPNNALEAAAIPIVVGDEL